MKKLGITNIMKIARKNYFSASKCTSQTMSYMFNNSN